MLARFEGEQLHADACQKADVVSALVLFKFVRCGATQNSSCDAAAFLVARTLGTVTHLEHGTSNGAGISPNAPRQLSQISSRRGVKGES
jgi:hypothetical protein